ncbi:MAG: hypothetical protein KAT77_03535 [Nanoarchaeota archaeon]|nr:hypothetical protein [Nanoarchaeota archaeon]
MLSIVAKQKRSRHKPKKKPKKPRSNPGFHFALPKSVKGKAFSVVEVGPYHERNLAKELNSFFGTQIEEVTKVNSYVLVHPKNLKGIEGLLEGKPFVDPIVHRASLNSPLALDLRLDFDYVFQSMLRPGTSDDWGNEALTQTLLALGKKPVKGDIGFLAEQYFVKGNLTSEQRKDISDFLANPELNDGIILDKKGFWSGHQVTIPVVNLKPKKLYESFNILDMSTEELMELNSKRRLAATLEEMIQFRDMYADKDFQKKRKKVGLPEKAATDVELETWFGLRSEHCFHKEFNARITLDDRVNDPLFERAYIKGWLDKNDKGDYVLERGIFNTFVKEPAEKIFRKLEVRGKNWIHSMFEDNSGVVLYDQDGSFCIKIETHNSPSAKEAVEGAKTGIDGVNRDIFGTRRGTFAAIANFFNYLTGFPDYVGWLPKGVKHPYVTLKGIAKGVSQGGNESQIGTENGGVSTDPRFIAKPLVYCGTVGWSPTRDAEGNFLLGKDPQPGDLVFIAGQPVGADAIHGATESSLIADKNISLGHVQKDFSFIQAKMKGYILEAARAQLFSSITDCGAVGLGSAALEQGGEVGGIWLDLKQHPIKYSGILPWQVIVSETQDRMVPIARPENEAEVLKRAKLHDVEVTKIGELNDSGYAHMVWGDKSVGLIDIEKLFDKEPRKEMHATWFGKPSEEPFKIKGDYSLEEVLCKVMEQPDVASREWFFRQKDSSVGGMTIQGPLIGLKQEIEADATMQKPLDTEGKDFGAIAYAMGIKPKQSDIDGYHSAQNAILEMIGKIVAIGGALPDMKNPKWDAWAVCGNYCQPNSDSDSTLVHESGERNLAALVREGMGVRDVEDKTNIPVISGKDSMKCSCVYEVDDSFKLEDVPADLRRHVTLVNSPKGRFIEIHDPPTYLTTGAVKIEDYRKCVSSDFKQAGDLIYVVGTTRNHLGASQLANAMGYAEQGAPLESGEVPKADLDEFVEVVGAIHKVIDEQLVASCKYIHDGGLLVSVAKSAMAGELSFDLEADNVYRKGNFSSTRDILFSETPGRYMVTIAPEDRDAFETALGNSVVHAMVGYVTDVKTVVTGQGGSTDFIGLDKVKKSFQKPLRFGLEFGDKK